MFIARWTIGVLLAVTLAVPSAKAWAQGNVTFRSDTPAVVWEAPADSLAGQEIGSAGGLLSSPVGIAPGFSRVILAPVTPEESELAIESRSIPEDLNLLVPEEGTLSGAETAVDTMMFTIQAAPTGPAHDPNGNPLGIGLLGVSLAFGLTVLTGAYALGHVSGGHFNPDHVMHGMVTKDGLAAAHAGDMGNIEISAGGNGTRSKTKPT